MKKTINFHRIFLVCYISIATLSVFFFNNLLTFGIINLGLLILLFIYTKKDIRNPALFFTIVLVLYEIAYPLLCVLGIKVFGTNHINDRYYLYSWLATGIFVISYGSLEKIQYDTKKICTKNNMIFLILIFFVLVILSGLGAINVIQLGLHNKIAVIQSNNIFINIGKMALTGLLPVTLFILLSNNINSNTKKFFLILCALMMIIALGVFGERNYILNLIIVIIFYYATFHNFSTQKMMTVGILCVILLAVSPYMKMMFSSNYYNNRSRSENGILVDFLSSDFISAGYNFNYLLDNEQQYKHKNGSSYIYDILSPIDDLVPQAKNYSVTDWYNNNFWSTRGFSIIAEGYVNFGVAGIILQMFILARMLKIIYKNSNRNIYLFIIYLGALPLAMYSCRESLAHIISPLFKYYILFGAILFMANKIQKDS